MTYGKSLNKADIHDGSWHELAQDRPTWRSTTKENLWPVLRTGLLYGPGHRGAQPISHVRFRSCALSLPELA